MKKIISVAASFLFTTIPAALAQACDPTREFCNPVGTSTFGDLMTRLYDFVFWISIAITPVIILYAAWLLVIAGGDGEKVTRARHIIIYAVLGLACVLIAKPLGAVIVDILPH